MSRSVTKTKWIFSSVLQTLKGQHTHTPHNYYLDKDPNHNGNEIRSNCAIKTPSMNVIMIVMAAVPLMINSMRKNDSDVKNSRINHIRKKEKKMNIGILLQNEITLKITIFLNLFRVATLSFLLDFVFIVYFVR